MEIFNKDFPVIRKATRPLGKNLLQFSNNLIWVLMALTIGKTQNINLKI